MAADKLPYILPKRKRFADEWLIDKNATRAAIVSGYAKSSAAARGHELLNRPDVKAYIRAMTERVSAKLEISFERTLLEIGRIAYQDVRKFFKETGELKPIHELDDDEAAAIAGFEIEEVWDNVGDVRSQIGELKKVKRWDKPKALEMLAKHFKLFSDAPINNNTFKFGYGPEQPV